jgi:hypothetical protein
MLRRFPHLSKLVIKILEIGGAGCASAVAASLLGTAHEPAKTPETMPPAIVRLAPADEQMIQHIREQSVALAEKLRSASNAHGTAAAPAPAASPAPTTPSAPAQAAKPAKAAAASPAPRREQKPVHAGAEAKQRAPEPYAAQAASALAAHPVSSTPANDAREERVTNVAAAPNELPYTPTQVPSRLWLGASSSLPDAPRPPVGVGEFAWSSM